jgi:hypothetical protein
VRRLVAAFFLKKLSPAKIVSQLHAAREREKPKAATSRRTPKLGFRVSIPDNSGMKAMILKDSADIHSSPLQLADLPDPEPGDGEVRLRVSCCAICRTDLHVIEAELPAQTRPLIPGHQVVGVVDRVGTNCQRLKIGQRIGVAWLRYTCGTCRFCTAGRENLCEASRFTGYHEDGGYAQYAVVPEDFAYELPETFTDIEATPLLCAGIIGYRALERSNLPHGGKLGIYGFGSSAHVVIQIAQHRGCEAYVVTRGEQHLRTQHPFRDRQHPRRWPPPVGRSRRDPHSAAHDPLFASRRQPGADRFEGRQDQRHGRACDVISTADRNVSKKGCPQPFMRCSNRSVQSQSQQAQGSLPFKSRQRCRPWASCTRTNSKYASQYGRSSSSGTSQKQTSTQRAVPSWQSRA